METPLLPMLGTYQETRPHSLGTLIEWKPFQNSAVGLIGDSVVPTRWGH